MPKALILGGKTGMLGQALSASLSISGWDIESLGRGDGDVLNPEFLQQKIDAITPDAVFNAIAWTQVDDAEDHPQEADRLNRALPLNLARILKSYPEIILYHFSTDFVFSGPSKGPWKESDEPSPGCVYGKTKLAGEKSALDTLPERCCVLRTAWLYGPGKKNFISTIIGLCNSRESVNVVDDQIGSPTYTVDVATWTAMLANKRQTGIWHVVNSGLASWYELAKEAVELSESPCRVHPIPSSQWPQKAARPVYSVLDNSKLADFLGKPLRPWPQALRCHIFGELNAEHQEMGR